jgi:hypothetical protein
MATVGWAVAGGAGTAAALAVAWFVLVTLRFDPPVARRSLAIARLDAAVTAGRSADQVLSVATWVGYVAATLVLGGLAFRTVVTRRPGRLPLGAAAGAGMVAAVVAVPLRAAEVTGDGLPAAADRDALVHVVTSAFGGRWRCGPRACCWWWLPWVTRPPARPPAVPQAWRRPRPPARAGGSGGGWPARGGSPAPGWSWRRTW